MSIAVVNSSFKSVQGEYFISKFDYFSILLSNEPLRSLVSDLQVSEVAGSGNSTCVVLIDFSIDVGDK